ncbi:MAG: hypothetical protein ACXWJU_07095 [Hyphomicrobium sp.]
MSGDRKFVDVEEAWGPTLRRYFAEANWASVSDEARRRFEDEFIDGCAKDAWESGRDPEEAFRGAVMLLLSNGYQPSKGLRTLITWELSLTWWPDGKARRRAQSEMRVEAERLDLEQTIARKRSEGLGDKVAVAQARKEVASRWGRNSAGALRKALQPNRMNRRQRSTAGPKQRKKCPVR